MKCFKTLPPPSCTTFMHTSMNKHGRRLLLPNNISKNNCLSLPLDSLRSRSRSRSFTTTINVNVNINTSVSASTASTSLWTQQHLHRHQYQHQHQHQHHYQLKNLARFSSTVKLKHFENDSSSSNGLLNALRGAAALSNTNNNSNNNNNNINNNVNDNRNGKIEYKHDDNNHSNNSNDNDSNSHDHYEQIMNGSTIGHLSTNDIQMAVDQIKLYIDTNKNTNKNTQQQSKNHHEKELELKKAIQIVYRLMDECECDNNANTTCTTDIAYDAICQVLNLVLDAGRIFTIGTTTTHDDSYYNTNSGTSSNTNANANANVNATSDEELSFCNIALDILQRMESITYQHHDYHMNNQSHNNNNNNNIDLRKTYNLVIDIVSKSQTHKNNNDINNTNYNNVNDNDNDNDTTIIIQDIIQKMEEAPYEWNVSPDTITYNSLLYAYSKKRHTKAAKAAIQCESLLRHMVNVKHIDVDTVSYNIVLDAWAKSTSSDYSKKGSKGSTNNNNNNNGNYKRAAAKAAEHGEILLNEMQELYQNGHGRNINVKPNVITFTTLLNIYSKSKELDAAERATSLLYTMEELYDGGNGDLTLKPNIMTYNAVLNVWANSHLPGSSQRAQDLLEYMISNCDKDNGNGSYHNSDSVVRPDMVSFAICIKAHANGDEKGSSDKAITLFKRMLDLANNNEQQHHDHDHDNNKYYTQPDIGTFNSVLRSLANDTNEKKATKAECLLRQINENKTLQANLTTYNNILRCCCTTRSDDEQIRRSAIRIATTILLQIRQTNGIVTPDPYTFNFFIKACDRLIMEEGGEGGGESESESESSKEKMKLIKVAFQFCIEEGQFSKPVLSILKNALKPNELRELLQLDQYQNLNYVKVTDFPLKWRDRVHSHSNTNNNKGNNQQRRQRQQRQQRQRQHQLQQSRQVSSSGTTKNYQRKILVTRGKIKRDSETTSTTARR